MAVTSAAIPPAPTGPRFDAVLFDRDGTLIHNVPYLADPTAVRPVPRAAEAIARLRERGLRIGVVTNQSGIGRGLLTVPQLLGVNRRVDELLGPFDTWQWCPHVDADECACRKPRPGMVLRAASDLGVRPERCVLIGDIAADVTAAQAAGAVGVLVPTVETEPRDVARAPLVAADLGAAVEWVLGGELARPAPAAEPAPPGGHVLAVRLDSAGDVLVTGPAIRAISARAATVTLWCGRSGRVAAELLAGVDRLVERPVAWVDPAVPVTAAAVDDLAAELRELRADRAVVFTSFHQSPLPTAVLLRMAGIGHISAISPDYPGGLLDVRHQVDDDVPESVRALSLAAAAGYPLPPGDDGRLRVREPLPDVAAVAGWKPYVVVHPGASVPARACPPAACAEFVADLSRAGWRVLVTGDRTEAELTAFVAGREGVDLGGRLSFAELAAVLAGARCVVVGNTGPAHLAAAVGTPVVSLFAPTVPFGRWAPYGVPVVRLGDELAPCRDSRATLCPVQGHPCLSRITGSEVVAAVEKLTCES